MIDSLNIGKRLQKVMDNEGLSAASFAEHIDVGRATISHILSGRNKPSLDVVMKVCSTFQEVELSWLLEGKGSYPNTSTTIQKSTKRTSNSEERKPIEINKNTSIKAEETSIISQEKSAERTTPKKVDKIVTFFTDGTFEIFYANSD